MPYKSTTSLRMPPDMRAQIKEIPEVNFTALMVAAAKEKLDRIQKLKAPAA